MDNAVQINDFATPTVHHAQHALLTSTETPRTLHHAQSNTFAPTYLSLEDVDYHSRQQLINYWNAIFDGLEQFLFRTTDGAVPAVCAAIAVLFLVTMVLRSSTKAFGILMLMEAGAEAILQALFGLLSVSHRRNRDLGCLATIFRPRTEFQ